MRKNKVLKTAFIALAGLGLVFTTSCDRNKGGGGEVPNKGLVIHWNVVFDGNPITIKVSEHTRSNGQVMKVSSWALILSKMSLVKTDNSEVQLGDGYVFIDFASGKTSQTYETVPPGDYKGISFQFGLDSAVNHGDPAAWPANHPLNGAYTGLHWGWAGGYIFQALDGNWKENDTMPSWQGMSFHTVGDAFKKNFFVPFNFTLNTDRQTAEIEANVAEIFKNPTLIDFKTDGSYSHSTSTTELTLMSKLWDNMGDVFTVKSVK